VDAKVERVKVLLLIDGKGELSFRLTPAANGGTDVNVAVNPSMRPDALLGILLLSLDSLMVHTANKAELHQHWKDFQPLVRDMLELNELILSVTVELEQLEEFGGKQ